MFTENKKLNFFIGLGLLVIITVVYPAIFMAVFFRLTDILNGYPSVVYNLALSSELVGLLVIAAVLVVKHIFSKD